MPIQAFRQDIDLAIISRQFRGLFVFI